MENKKIILNEIKNTLEAIKENDSLEAFEILNDEIKKTMEIEGGYDIYISHLKNLCIRSYAPIQYYYYLINKLNIINHWVTDGLYCEAEGGRFFSVSWCEHDLIISFKPVIKEFEWERRFYTIESGNIPDGWILWNVKPIIYNNKYYILAVLKNEIRNFTINIKNVRAYEISENDYKIATEHKRAGSPEELKRHLKSKDLYYKKHALYFKPVIEKLYNVKIDEV